MIDHVSRPAHKYGFTLQNSRILVDGANPAVIRSVKDDIGEDSNYEEIIERYKAMKFNYEQSMIVLPVNFSQEHKTMLVHAKQLLEDKHFIQPIPNLKVNYFIKNCSGRRLEIIQGCDKLQRHFRCI